jgi:serine/threonine protein kinase
VWVLVTYLVTSGFSGSSAQVAWGVVYLAREEHLERRVALKVIAPHLAQSEDFRRRFIGEARNAAAIDHPNVVTVYSSGTIDGNLYIAMRYVEGSDLRAVLREDGPLAMGVATKIVSEVAAAWTPPTPPAWSTATSSRQTSCSKARRAPARAT